MLVIWVYLNIGDDGDTKLGRIVAESQRANPPGMLWTPQIGFEAAHPQGKLEITGASAGAQWEQGGEEASVL